MITANAEAVRAARAAATGMGYEPIPASVIGGILNAAIPHLTDAGQPLSQDEPVILGGFTPAARVDVQRLLEVVMDHVTERTAHLAQAQTAQPLGDDPHGDDTKAPGGDQRAVAPGQPVTSGPISDVTFYPAEPVQPGPARKVLSTTLANLAETLARQDARDSARRLLAEARAIVDGDDLIDTAPLSGSLDERISTMQSFGAGYQTGFKRGQTSTVAAELLPRFEALRNDIHRVGVLVENTGHPLTEVLTAELESDPRDWAAALQLAVASVPPDPDGAAKWAGIVLRRSRWFYEQLTEGPTPTLPDEAPADDDRCACGAAPGSHLGDCPAAGSTTPPTPDGHVHYVAGEDEQTAALRQAINVNRQIAGIDPPNDGPMTRAAYIPRGFRTGSHSITVDVAGSAATPGDFLWRCSCGHKGTGYRAYDEARDAGVEHRDGAN